MNSIYFVLMILYVVIPAVILSRSMARIRGARNNLEVQMGYWNVHHFLTFVIAFSFLPILGFTDVNLNLISVSPYSVLAYFASLLLVALTLHSAIVLKKTTFYIAGVKSAFFEEVLFRSVVYGFAFAIWNNPGIALVVSSVLFGLWHLKNGTWIGWSRATKQALYAGVIVGPLLGYVTIATGDIAFAILFHLLHNLVLTFLPNILTNNKFTDANYGK